VGDDIIVDDVGRKEKVIGKMTEDELMQKLFKSSSRKCGSILKSSSRKCESMFESSSRKCENNCITNIFVVHLRQ
jgi:hypothetical protein